MSTSMSMAMANLSREAGCERGATLNVQSWYRWIEPFTLDFTRWEIHQSPLRRRGNLKNSLACNCKSGLRSPAPCARREC